VIQLGVDGARICLLEKLQHKTNEKTRPTTSLTVQEVLNDDNALYSWALASDCSKGSERFRRSGKSAELRNFPEFGPRECRKAGVPCLRLRQ
jgi:hypothetical protein